MRNTTLIRSLLLVGLVLTTSAWATQPFAVDLQVNNLTNQTLIPVASLNYEQNGQMNWQVPIPTSSIHIAPHTQHVSIDNRNQLTAYDLNYLDFQDINGKLVVSCLEDYYATSTSINLIFTVAESNSAPGRYVCKHQTLPF